MGIHAGQNSHTPDPNFDDMAWDNYRDALDAMQRRIDAMGPMLDAYDAPNVHMDQLHRDMQIDADLSINDYEVLFDPSHEI